MMRAESGEAVGLYLHFPFCVRKCSYCDFCSFPQGGATELRSRYLPLLLREMQEYATRPPQAVDTVFVGGGTPSLMTPGEIERLFAALHATFAIQPGAEISVEANPGTLDADRVAALRAAGVNRVSLGLQSAVDREAKRLGRIHTWTEFFQSYRLLRDAGFANINVDLMYGIPDQTEDSFRYTLDAITELLPEHISCYGLMLEEGTPLWVDRAQLRLPDEETECRMYELAVTQLCRHGYDHYEISNYARPGYACRHNLKYWRDEAYIGLGLSAHSFYRGRRYYNTSRPEVYAAGTGEDYRIEEDSRGEADGFEYAMLRLRLSEGLSLEEYRRRFGTPFAAGREALVRRLCDAGLMSLTGDRLSLTDRGFYLSNSILAELL